MDVYGTEYTLFVDQLAVGGRFIVDSQLASEVNELTINEKG